MKDCVFCKIVKGEIPCYKIYEDDFVLAFLDIANDTYGHTLVIPKKHYESMMTIDNTTLSRVMEVTKKIGNHYVKDCGFEGWNIVNNCGKAANQAVMHLHIHLFPRKTDDKVTISTHMAGCGEVTCHGNGPEKVVITPFKEKWDLQEVCDKLKLEPEEEQKVVLDDENYVVLYTDGACSGNPGAGGWASILSFKGKEKVLSGGELQTTNNRMELLAVINGLEAVKNAETPVQVFSDSAYVVNAFVKGWIKSWQANSWKTASKDEVLNKDLWQRLLAQTERLDVTFNKVKGHSDNALNNRCDKLAREEIAKLQ